jgi:hypothetical protein
MIKRRSKHKVGLSIVSLEWWITLFSLIHTVLLGELFQARPKLFGKPKLLRELRVAERQRGFACGADLMETGQDRTLRLRGTSIGRDRRSQEWILVGATLRQLLAASVARQLLFENLLESLQVVITHVGNSPIVEI